MPNWVTHQLTISGSKKELTRFLETTKKDDQYFSFETLISKPEGFNSDLSSPVPLEVEALIGAEKRIQEILQFPWVDLKKASTIEERKQLAVFLQSRTDPQSFKAEEFEHILGEIQQRAKAYLKNIKLTNCPSWYEWNNENWGTKWDACQVDVSEIESVNAEEGEIQLNFNTAWGTPQPIFDVIRQEFPSLIFNGTIDEEGGYFYIDIVDNEWLEFSGSRYKPEEDDDEEPFPSP